MTENYELLKSNHVDKNVAVCFTNQQEVINYVTTFFELSRIINECPSDMLRKNCNNSRNNSHSIKLTLKTKKLNFFFISNSSLNQSNVFLFLIRELKQNLFFRWSTFDLEVVLRKYQFEMTSMTMLKITFLWLTQSSWVTFSYNWHQN